MERTRKNQNKAGQKSSSSGRVRGGYIIDTTLRDGEQAPGVVFTLPEKLRIAAMLEELGINEVEVGTPAMGPDEQQVISEIVKSGFRFDKLCWARARESDVEASARTGANRINISFPVSDIQLSAIGRNRGWVLGHMPRMVALARRFFGFVAIGFQDASRADRDFMDEFITACLAEGVDRIRLADTVGTLNPFSVAELFTSVTQRFPFVDFEFHGHNDLGMATANSLAAFLSGARSVSATINGLGERAGNACLEELAMAMKVSANMNPGLNMPMVQEICRYVSDVSYRAIHESKPITGEMICRHESGIHCRSLMENELAYQPFRPEELGRKTELVIGKHSGSGAVKRYLNNHGVSLQPGQIDQLMNRLKSKSGRERRVIAFDEVLTMVNEDKRHISIF